MELGNYLINESSRPYFLLASETEKNFDVDGFKDWIDNSSHYSLYITAVYLIATQLCFNHMHRMPAYNVRRFLVPWNVCLAFMCAWGASRTVPELLYVLQQHGYESSLCEYKNFEANPEAVCAIYVFCILKVVELFDTVFLILRKSYLIFVHQIQHGVVLIYTWYAVADRVALGRWLLSVNYTVHSFMYTYYALRALGLRIPKVCCTLLTMVQILQVLVGFAMNVSIYSKWLGGSTCAMSGRVLTMGMVLYSAYFMLFLMFLYYGLSRPEAYKAEKSNPEDTSYLREDRFTQKRKKQS